MAFEKAVIKVLEGKNKDKEIKVLYNPNSYTIQSSVKYSAKQATGTEPKNQYVCNDNQTLTMELFFDTSLTNEDVRKYSDPILGLMEIDSELHRPPKCSFIWGPRSGGQGNFEGLLTDVTQKYTMFYTSGVPVRATLNVTFRSDVDIQDQSKKKTQNSADRTKQQVLNQGEQLWMLAEKEYEDPGQWREIARANNIDNPRLPQYGRTVVIPRLE